MQGRLQGDQRPAGSGSGQFIAPLAIAAQQPLKQLLVGLARSLVGIEAGRLISQRASWVDGPRFLKCRQLPLLPLRVVPGRIPEGERPGRCRWLLDQGPLQRLDR